MVVPYLCEDRKSSEYEQYYIYEKSYPAQKTMKATSFHILEIYSYDPTDLLQLI
jgi:hypothetical protein